MTRKITHPLWIHLPGLAILLFTVTKIVTAWPLPDRVPLKFSSNGAPTQWGSPWEGYAIMLGIMVGFFVLTVFLSELWARQETRKQFNWLSLLDDAIGGAMAMTIAYWLNIAQQQSPVWNTPWATIAGVPAGATLIAAILEWLRPFRPYLNAIQAEAVDDVEAAVADHIRAGKDWAYLETQNPRYISILTLVLLIVFAVVATLMLRATSSWFSWSFLLVPVAVGTFTCGGLRVKIAQNSFVLRLGIFGIRGLRISFEEIEAVSTQTFSPLADFGGWGPGRYGWPQWARHEGKSRRVRAFYYRGTEGVKISCRGGRIYLIGSDHPERLYAVLRSAAGLVRATDEHTSSSQETV